MIHGPFSALSSELAKKAIAFASRNELNIALDRKVDRLLVERVGRSPQELSKLLDSARRYREQVSSACVVDRRIAWAVLVLAWNESIAAVERLWAGMSRWERSANFVSERVPGRGLVRLLVRITDNRNEELALNRTLVHVSPSRSFNTISSN
jgi:hypothetical protein